MLIGSELCRSGFGLSFPLYLFSGDPSSISHHLEAPAIGCVFVNVGERSLPRSSYGTLRDLWLFLCSEQGLQVDLMPEHLGTQPELQDAQMQNKTRLVPRVAHESCVEDQVCRVFEKDAPAYPVGGKERVTGDSLLAEEIPQLGG